MIIAGNRRYHGAIAAGLTELPCVVRITDADRAYVLSAGFQLGDHRTWHASCLDELALGSNRQPPSLPKLATCDARNSVSAPPETPGKIFNARN